MNQVRTVDEAAPECVVVNHGMWGYGPDSFPFLVRWLINCSLYLSLTMTWNSACLKLLGANSTRKSSLIIIPISTFSIRGGVGFCLFLAMEDGGTVISWSYWRLIVWANGHIFLLFNFNVWKCRKTNQGGDFFTEVSASIGSIWATEVCSCTHQKKLPGDSVEIYEVRKIFWMNQK